MDQVLIDRLREPGALARGLSGITGDRSASAPAESFAEIMTGLVGDANQKQVQAESDAAGLARGDVDLMDAVVSMNEADLSLRLIMQIRDRALEAYRSILQSI